MNEKIVTIAIPTYNMEQWLNRCLDSVVIPEIIDKVEIIVVNDGSTDRSSEIAHSYADKYPDSVIVIDKLNGNYGSCVNKALEIATGKYFRILDADDWFDSRGLSDLIRKLEDVTVDMVFTDYQIVYANKSKVKKCQCHIPHIGTILPIDSDVLLGLRANIDLTMHHITYRTQMMRDMSYIQQEKISYTDSEYVFYPLRYVKTVIFYNIILYQYYVGREGQTVSIKSKIEHASDLLKIIQRMMSCRDTSQLQRIYLVFIFSCYYHNLLVLQKLTQRNNQTLKRLDREIMLWDKNLYMRMNSIRCLKIPYIKIWRHYDMQVICPVLYRFLYRVFYIG